MDKNSRHVVLRAVVMLQRLALLVLILGALVPLGSSRASQPAAREQEEKTVRALFANAPATRDAVPGQQPGIVRQRQVAVDTRALAREEGMAADIAPAQWVRLNLFGDVDLPAELVRIDHVSPDSYAWVGRVSGEEMSQVTLIVRGETLAGSISLPDALYRIRYAEDGLHTIQEMDPAAFRQEAEPLVPEEPQGAPAAAGDTFLADDGSVIDLLVVYTDDARAMYGTAGIQNLIDLAVVETNTSYANSGINQRLNLVHKAEVAYGETGDIYSALYHVTDKGDGQMDSVHTLRETHCADEVVLIIANGGAYCGVAWQMQSVSPSFESYAFAVVDEECAAGYYSLGHELGHNMGARHDWYVDDGVLPYGYAHGYVNATDRWRTIMAYNNACADGGFNCTRLQYWSNPAVSYGGDPMGVPAGTSTSCSPGIPNPNCDADNRQTLNNTAFTLANFRTSCYAPPAAPTNLSATAVSSSRINLSWTDNSTNEVGFKIERSPNGSTSWIQIATVGANVTIYPNTGLSSGTTYYYRVRAYHLSGDSAYSNVASTTTWPPPAPTNLSAMAISQGQINLSWTDNSTDEDGFKVERSPNGTTGWAQIASVGANTTSYPDTGLSAGATYHYRVRAYRGTSNSAYSNVASATTYSDQPGPLTFHGYVIDDDMVGESNGNGNGRIDCGETVEVNVELHNEGGGTAMGVSAAVAIVDPYTTLLFNTSSSYPDIRSGDVAWNDNDFDLAVSASAPHGHYVQFNLNVTASNGGPWSDSFQVPVFCTPPDAMRTYLPLMARYVGFDAQFNGSAPGWQFHAGTWWFDYNDWLTTDGVVEAWASTSYEGIYDSFDYRANLWSGGCTSCQHGLLVRGTPNPLGDANRWRSGYGFYINRTGHYAVFKYTAGIASSLQNWTPSVAIEQGEAWNLLRVVADGNSLRFYINGSLVWTGVDPSYIAGRVGITTYRLAGTNHRLWADWATLAVVDPAFQADEVPPEQQALNGAAARRAGLGSDATPPGNIQVDEVIHVPPRP